MFSVSKGRKPKKETIGVLKNRQKVCVYKLIDIFGKVNSIEGVILLLVGLKNHMNNIEQLTTVSQAMNLPWTLNLLLLPNP